MKAYIKNLIKRGQVKYQQGHYNKAIAHFTQAIELDSHQVDAYLYRGRVYGDLGNFLAAIADLTQALNLDLNCFEAYILRGGAYVELGSCLVAIADFTQALNLRPHCPDVRFFRGLAYLKVGDSSRAKEEMQIAAQIFLQEADLKMYGEVQTVLNAINNLPKQFQAEVQSRAVSKAKQGDVKAALPDFEFLVRLHPQDAAGYVNLGLAWSNLVNLERGIDGFNRAIMLNPELPEAYFNRGTSFGLLGNYQAAIDDFNQTIRLNPYYAAAYLNRALAYFCMSNVKAAFEDVGKACELFHQQEDMQSYKKAWSISLQLLIQEFQEYISLENCQVP